MIEIEIFILATIMMLIAVCVGITKAGLPAVACSLLAASIAFVCSKSILNRTVVRSFTNVLSNDSIVTTSVPVESAALSYIFMFVGIVMILVFLLQTLHEVQYQLSPDLDIEVFDNE